MRDTVRRESSAVEYFKDLVDGALAHQRMAAGELTAFYVVQLLTSFVARRAGDDEPLALKLARAMDECGLRQRRSLRAIGDLSLFVSGFFSGSFRRRLVDVGYYAAIGGYAYLALSRDGADALAPVFAELADNFGGFIDVLGEVSERTSCATNADLLRLYEKWLETGSARSGQRLVELGVVPNLSLLRSTTRLQ
ncbi:MAG: hypothetical protein IT176_04780 [Acidobacteria bacterium]|nr:hypothetical protein [Acidobacteriota bacterium]